MELRDLVVLILVGVTYSAPGDPDDVQFYDYEKQPQPYEFGYKINDKYGNSQTRRKTGNRHGSKVGFYSYKDDLDVYRQVEYTADGRGFRATIKTNEPGVRNQNPADVNVTAEEPPIGVQETSDFHPNRLHIAQFPQASVKTYVPRTKAIALGNHHKPRILKHMLVQVSVPKNDPSAFLFPKFRTAFVSKTASALVLIPIASIGSHNKALISVPFQKSRRTVTTRPIPVLVIKKLKDVSKLLHGATLKIIKGHKIRVHKVNIHSGLTDFYDVSNKIAKVPKQHDKDTPVYKDK